MTEERTIKCPTCNNLYIYYPYFGGNQSVCPKCLKTSRLNLNKSELKVKILK